MKDCFDVVEDIKSLINIPAITSNITGLIYTDERLSGSDKVDIVVNCMSITNDLNQVASGNVNVYAPNYKPQGNGKVQSLPDRATFKRVVKLLTPYLDVAYKFDFSTEVDESAGVLIKDPDGNWYANIPITYRSYNKNYKNI